MKSLVLRVSLLLALLVAAIVLPAGWSQAAGDFLTIHSPVADECATTDAGVNVLTDFSFAVAPTVDLMQYVDGTYLGNYDLSFFYAGLTGANVFLNLESDFAFTQPDTNFVYEWHLIASVGGETVAYWLISTNCGTGAVSVQNMLLASAAGCDSFVNLPATAVGGAFVADAPTYWTPGELTDPLVTLEAGKTAWVLGLDATGSYYKILWQCVFLWVPAHTMGPNYDAVWNGTPLPTGVVE
ncbi:MAG: hypothetical protein JW910_02455 [Anaerolineae bacterium]|nr:hypothetical protein [Anaerolineae bacterium]